MPSALRRVRVPWATAAVLLVLAGAAAGCDDAAKPKPDERKSVMQGGTPESDAGRKVEDAKQKIEGAEKQLEDRDERMFEQAQGEQAGRGVP